MMYSLFFILAFSLGAFAQKVAPGPIENGDDFSYNIVLGTMEYYLRRNVTDTKPCYLNVKQEYFEAIQQFGWDLNALITEGVLTGLGKNKKQKDKIEKAIRILNKEIAGNLYNNYLNPLWVKIRGLHFHDAALLMNGFRQSIRDNFGEYKRVMNEIKSSIPKNYNDIEGRLRGARGDIKLTTERITRRFNECMKQEKCKKSVSS